MPQKKVSGTHAKQPAEPPIAVTLEGGDPIATFISVVDKKARNLEKRKNKLTTLKESDGLDKDQLEAVSKIKDVTIQLELVKELQKQFSAIETEYAKLRKRQQRVEKQQAKEAEHVAKERAVTYTLRVTDMLNNVGEEDQEIFRSGSEGAIKLSEDELTQIDEFYKVITPQRAGNSKYESELSTASEHMLSLMDGSPKDVVGTSYKVLQEVITKMDASGYFDRVPEPLPDEDSEEDGDDYKSADDQIQSPGTLEDIEGGDTSYTEEVDIPPEVPPSTEPEGPPEQLMMPPKSGPVDSSPVELGNSPLIMAQTSGIMNYLPSAPSPTFPALGTSPVLLSHADGFSFMHESELDRNHSSNSSLPSTQSMLHQSLTPTPAQGHQSHHSNPHTISTYAQYNTRGGVGVVSGGADVMVGESMTSSAINQNSLKTTTGQSTTDVATGQPNPSIQQQYQPGTGNTIDTTTTTSTGVMPSSAGVIINQDLGVVGGGSTEVGLALYSNVMPTPNETSSSGFNRQQQQQLPQGQQNSYYKGPPQQNRGDRNGRGFNQGGGRRGWNRGNYGASKNGRGMQGGMDGQGQSYGSSRNYGDRGGYPQQQQRGGRPNYRTNAGGAGAGAGGQRRS